MDSAKSPSDSEKGNPELYPNLSASQEKKEKDAEKVTLLTYLQDEAAKTAGEVKKTEDDAKETPKEEEGVKFETATNKRKILIIVGVILAVLAVCVIVVVMVVLLYQGSSLSMSFKPQPNKDTTLIKFEQGKPEAYYYYKEDLTEFLTNYENEQQDGENFLDCTNLDEESRDKSKPCRFSLDNLGPSCTWQKDYGYDEGEPCVLLMINKVKGWEPTLFNNRTGPPTDAELGDRWDDFHVPVNCYGENSADRENMGPIEFWPKMGFHRQYFPYLAQEGYRQPLVFVQFKRPKNGPLIQITCKIWQPGMTLNDETGSVHFELLID